MKPREFTDLKPKVVLGVAAHPDDLDFGSGGTLAKFAADGAEVHYLLLTDGSKGTEDMKITAADLIKMRQEEQKAACDLIGGKEVHFLNHADGALEVTQDLKAEIVKVIRTVRPEVVITMDPSMIYSDRYGFINHPDHRAAGQSTLDAVFPLARDHLSFPELFAQGYKPHKVNTVLLTNFERHNYYVDITKTLDKKLGTLTAHASQVSDPAGRAELFTQMAARLGQEAGCTYAEGFIRLDVMG